MHKKQPNKRINKKKLQEYFIQSCVSLTSKWMESTLSFQVCLVCARFFCVRFVFKLVCVCVCFLFWDEINDKFKNWLPYLTDKFNLKTFMGLSERKNDLRLFEGDKTFSYSKHKKKRKEKKTIGSRSPISPFEFIAYTNLIVQRKLITSFYCRKTKKKKQKITDKNLPPSLHGMAKIK